MIRSRAREYAATHLVCYECLDMSSPCFGDRTSLVVGGSSTTLHQLEDVDGQHLPQPFNDLPSQRQYPVSYVDLTKHPVPTAQEIRNADPEAPTS